MVREVLFEKKYQIMKKSSEIRMFSRYDFKNAPLFHSNTFSKLFCTIFVLTSVFQLKPQRMEMIRQLVNHFRFV